MRHVPVIIVGDETNATSRSSGRINMLPGTATGFRKTVTHCLRGSQGGREFAAGTKQLHGARVGPLC